MTAEASREYTDTDLSGARFVRCDLSDVVVRASNVSGARIDDPWLAEGGSLVVNGVDVVPLVEAALNQRFPGREQRTAETPDGLRAAWEQVQSAWQRAIERAQRMPEGTVDRCVDGEWSFAQTLRHLVMATDVWLRKAILGVEQPYHPIGQPHAEYEMDGYDPAVFAESDPSFERVLQVRAERVAMVREFLARLTPERLDEWCAHPWGPGHTVTVRSCLHTILGEEWEHLRYATRDLDALEGWC